MLNSIPDTNESSQGEAKWDFLGITDVDEEEESKMPAASMVAASMVAPSMVAGAVGGNPFVQPVMNILTYFNKTPDDTREPMPVEVAVKSKQLLSIDMEVYINGRRLKAVLVITDHVMVTFYKSKGYNPVIPPMKVNDIETLCLAESMPSGAALHFKEEV